MSHPYLMIKILSEKKKIPVSCTHGRMCAFGRYAPEIKKLLPYLSSFMEPDESEPAVIKNAGISITDFFFNQFSISWSHLAFLCSKVDFLRKIGIFLDGHVSKFWQVRILGTRG